MENEKLFSILISIKDVINYSSIFLFRWSRPNLIMISATEEKSNFSLVFFHVWNASTWTPTRELPWYLALSYGALFTTLSWCGLCLSQVQFAVHCQRCHSSNWILLMERRWLFQVWTHFVFHDLKILALVLTNSVHFPKCILVLSLWRCCSREVGAISNPCPFLSPAVPLTSVWSRAQMIILPWALQVN